MVIWQRECNIFFLYYFIQKYYFLSAKMVEEDGTIYYIAYHCCELLCIY